MIEPKGGTIEPKGAIMAKSIQFASNLQGFLEAKVGYDRAKGEPLSSQRWPLSQNTYNLQTICKVFTRPRWAMIEPKGGHYRGRGGHYRETHAISTNLQGFHEDKISHDRTKVTTIEPEGANIDPKSATIEPKWSTIDPK
jgi:hypothetical protein